MLRPSSYLHGNHFSYEFVVWQY